MTLRHPRIALGHLVMTLRHPRIALGHLVMTVGHATSSDILDDFQARLEKVAKISTRMRKASACLTLRR
jgi:hypothetical protein